MYLCCSIGKWWKRRKDLLYGELMDGFQCCHNFFGNFQITRLCYPNFLATKNTNKIQITIS